ncbi:MAG: TrkH family potassium uptake protein [Oscillospiraceae bacterium]|nr:TrkH family potassium uptake protein [Oscillospiraceae bacterium]
MNGKMIVYLTGQIVRVIGVLLILPMIVAGVCNEKASLIAFLVTAAGMIALGTAVSYKKPENKAVYAREGMAVVAISWILMSVLGALPFVISGEIPNFADAVFETASGFTTTGSTILTDIEAMSRSCLFWRSFTHFIGGMGVLMFMLMILPQSDTRTMYLVRAEAPGPTAGKLAAKMSLSVRILYAIYLTLTFSETLLLLAGGMPFFDAITTAFSTAGTGGFSIRAGSIADYDSAYIDFIVTLFMALFSVNFTIFFLIVSGKIRQAFFNEELRAFLCIVAVSTAVITANITGIYGSVLKALRYAGFQVLTVMSTAGFGTADYTEWPVLSQFILILLMFVGSCAGSTGGGLKVIRVIVLFKSAVKEVRSTLSPRSVMVVKYDGKALEKEVVHGISYYFAVFMILMTASILLLSIDGHDLTTTVTAVITCINNVGPGLGEVGPSGNFAGFSEWAKCLLAFDMLLGRLEIYPLLVLLSLRKKY